MKKTSKGHYVGTECGIEFAVYADHRLLDGGYSKNVLGWVSATESDGACRGHSTKKQAERLTRKWIRQKALKS